MAPKRTTMGAAASTAKPATRSPKSHAAATAAEIKRDFDGKQPLKNLPACWHCDQNKALTCYRHPSGDQRKPCYECSKNSVHGTGHCNHSGRIPDYLDRRKGVWFVGMVRMMYMEEKDEYDAFNPDPRADDYSDSQGRKGWEGRLAHFVEIGVVGPNDTTAEQAILWPEWPNVVKFHHLCPELYIAAPREPRGKKGKQAAKRKSTRGSKATGRGGAPASASGNLRDTDYSSDELQSSDDEGEDDEETPAEPSTSRAKRTRRDPADTTGSGFMAVQTSSSGQGQQAEEAQEALDVENDLAQAFAGAGIDMNLDDGENLTATATAQPQQQQQSSSSTTAASPRPVTAGNTSSSASAPTGPAATGQASNEQPATSSSTQQSAPQANLQADGSQGQSGGGGGAPSGNQPDHISCNPYGRPPFAGKLSAELIKKLASSARGAVVDFARRGGPPAGDPSGAGSTTSGREKLKTYAYAAQPPRGEYRRRAGSEPPPSTAPPSDDANARPAAEEHPITMDKMTAMEALEYIIHVVYEGPDAVYSAEAAAHLLKACIVLEQLLPVVGAKGMGAEQYLYSMSYTGVTYFNFGKRNHGWPWRIWAQDFLESVVNTLREAASPQHIEQSSSSTSQQQQQIEQSSSDTQQQQQQQIEQSSSETQQQQASTEGQAAGAGLPAL